MLDQKKSDVAVIVGRFQVPKLHEGHTQLINTVIASHQRVIVVLGVAHSKCSFNNPYDLGCRKTMFAEQYPEITVLYIKDMQDDKAWSRKLDEIIEDEVAPESTITLYGSRDSFIKAYHGKYPTVELQQKSFTSGTAERKALAHAGNKNYDFRRGLGFGVANQYPGPEMTIDVAIIDDVKGQILLGRKKDEEGWRIIGGFVQNQETLEDCVIREAREETGLKLHDPRYVKSFVSSDWRKAGERDKILTALFTATIVKGTPEPDDDIHELRWFDLNKDLLEAVISNHKDMIEVVLDRCQPAG